MGQRGSISLKKHWFQILLALADRDLHGLGIQKEVLQTTNNELHLWPGMLYGSLQQLTTLGLIAEVPANEDVSTGGGQPRFYRLTDPGKRALVAELRRLESYLEIARRKQLLEAY